MNEMTEQKDSSSLPILLAIAGSVLLSVAIGWIVLDQDSQTQIDPSESPMAVAQESTSIEPAIDVPVTSIDANLRTARLAAEADVLAYPPEQSALHFYGRIMAAEPDHAIANAELDAVLSRISGTVTSHLAAAKFDEAYGLALLVAEVRPDDPLVHEVQRTLDAIAGKKVNQAMQHAQDGREDDAIAALSAAEALPGRQPDYFAAVRDSMSEISKSRRAAEIQRTETSRQAAALATTNWVEKVRGAIELGRLITPPGESARDYLAERSTPDEQKEQLTKELVAEVIAATKVNIGLDQLPAAETMLNAADELASNDPELKELRVSLERAYIAAEASRIKSTNELVRLKTTTPRYPWEAKKRSITGWVEVMFTVTSSGETDDIEVLRSDPQSIFDKSAIHAIEQWTFEPPVFRGQRINQRTAVRLVFNLD